MTAESLGSSEAGRNQATRYSESKGAEVSPGSAGALRHREEFLFSLIFSEENPALTSQLLEACARTKPAPHAVAPVYSYLLNNPSPEIRVAAGRNLGSLFLPDTDLAPLLFSAYKRERNERARNSLRESLSRYPYGRISELENYYETSRFTVQAKKADLRSLSGTRELSPQQVDRALILLHLDPSGEAKLAATSALCSSIRYFTPAQRQALVPSFVYGLSDPEQASEFVTSSLLFMGEWIGAEASVALPLVRKLYDSDSPRVRADSALVGLCLGGSDPEASRLVIETIRNRSSLNYEVEELDLEHREPPPLERSLDELARWVGTICQTEADSAEITALLENVRDSYIDAYQNLARVIDARMALLSKRVREATRKPDELTRELYILRVAGRTDRIDATNRRSILRNLFDIADDIKEPLDARKALISRLVLNREDTGYILSRLTFLLRDDAQSPEIRLTACKSIPHLTNLKREQVLDALNQISIVADTASLPIIRQEAEALKRTLKS